MYYGILFGVVIGVIILTLCVALMVHLLYRRRLLNNTMPASDLPVSEQRTEQLQQQQPTAATATPQRYASSATAQHSAASELASPAMTTPVTATAQAFNFSRLSVPKFTPISLHPSAERLRNSSRTSYGPILEPGTAITR